MPSKLFEPGRIGDLIIKNRVVMAPMGVIGLVEMDGRFSERAIDYYAARAEGGTGLIITGACAVDNTVECKMVDCWSTLPRVDSPMFITRLSELADAVHEYGAKIALQLTAGMGRVISASLFPGARPVAPSSLPWIWDPSIMARELSKTEIKKLVEAFGQAAGIVKVAGIDAIELHGHEGYLLDQFKTALWNKRTDEYGGSLEGRLRFPLEVIQAIKAGAGKDFPVIYRYGIKHYLPGGRELEESLEIAKRFEKAGVSALHVDAGCYETWYWAHPPIYMPSGCMVELAAEVKKVVSIPVITVGKLGSPELSERVLREGMADFVALGRPLLADPEWPNKVREGRLDEICPCIGDQEGCFSRIFERKYISCTVNPTVGMEKKLVLTPALKPKVVFVIGGGPGGMEAARVAALRGHQVTLWEKHDRLGGNLLAASVPDFKQDLRPFIDYLSTQIKKLRVKVVLGKEVTPEEVLQAKPAAVIVATGATSIVPLVKGMKDDVVTAVELLLGRKRVGQKILIAGGGLVGCETAVYLAQMEKKVTVVEMLGDVALGMNKTNRMKLLEMLANSGVDILTGTRLVEITNQGVVVKAEGTLKTLNTDTIVLALGFRPEAEFVEKLRGQVSELYSVGDCVRPRGILDAIWEAYRIGRLL